MKIAVVTANGVTISQHFGRAPFYAVYTVEQGKIVRREKRDKASSADSSGHDCQADPGCHDAHHSPDADTRSQHAGMLANILDSEVLIAGGMGYGAYACLQSSGIKPVITDCQDIDEAIQSYLDGRLINQIYRLH